ncbi:BTAD domain-containing putative transcriptional regulator [Mycolicibacterium bacteremicum]|uniref:BTAD domain-containing putative transcriptional regulator n=1 Tax=Mycolicibacterium bacteremicum TaxID=564198 RepID=UPI001F324A45|nr:BTAD domain-containing putative transcriptional regulator [Mycolicibacterium bacteremicum]
MHYRLLGPLEVVRDGARVDIGPPKQRAVLAVLLLAQGGVVSVDRLIDAVWGDDVPGSATASLQAYVSNLRRVLRDDAGVSPIVRRPPGYHLELGSATVDTAELAAGTGRAATAVADGRWDDAIVAADAALALWRGPLLADLRDEAWLAAESARIDELRTECLDARITAFLAVGRVSSALADIEQLRRADPFRDRGCWLQMVALYRSGRTAEALDAYAAHARRLDDELGLQPGAELQQVQTAVLRQAPELAAWPRSPGWTGAESVSTPAPAPVAEVEPAVASGGLVGRTREMEALTRLLVEARAGATRWLVLSGPPGIGKTRLAEEAAARVRAAGGDAVWVSCPDERGIPPWWPMRQLVRALGADADEVLAVPAHADPDTARFAVYERVQRLLESGSGLLAVVIDDVQWADSASAACLAYIAGTLRDRPLAIVLTVRDGDHSSEVLRLLGTATRGANRHIEVPALSAADVATLANQVADETVEEAEASALADRTGGNPFFVSEYARLPRAERLGGEIPIAVKSVLDLRLGGLDPAVLQMLRTAAIIGDAIDRDALPVLAGATRLDLDTLADYLDEAADERIVVAAPTGDGYVFAHGLLRDQLIAGMPALRRQRVHAKVAEVLADATSDGALTRRAGHLVAALPLVEPHEVVAACRVAAERATASWSSDIAARWWQAALDAYDRLPAAQRTDADRDALTVAMLEAHSRAGRGRLVLDAVERNLIDALRAGRAVTAGRVASALLRASGGWPWLAPGEDPGAVLALLDRAAALCDAHPAAGARVCAALAVGHCYDPDIAVAARTLDRAGELAADAGDTEVTADVLMGRLITYSGVASAAARTLSCITELNELRHKRSREDTVIAASVATMAAMSLGDVDGAGHQLTVGIAGSEELQLPVLRAQLRWMEAVQAIWRGDFDEARRHHTIAAHVHEQTELYVAGSGMLAEVSLLWETGGPAPQLPEESAASGGQSMVTLARAVVLAMQHGPAARESARAMLTDRFAGNRGEIWTTLGHNTFLAHLAAEHRLPEFAAPLLAELEPFLNRIAVIGQVGLAGPVALGTARLHALAGDRDRAREHLARARVIAGRTGGKPSLVRCDLLDAELADPPRRAELIARVVAEATRLGMTGVAATARELG